MFSPSLTVRPALRTWAVCCVLFAGTVLLFSRSAGYGFTNYDDPRYVTGNEHVQAGLTWDGVVWAFTAPSDYWHPLTWLSHMLDWQLYAGNAGGHHLTSVGWHALNAVLAFLLLRRLTGTFWTSAFSAVVFAWHPLRVESVVWITERKDVMSGCFFLLTLWAYVAYGERRREKQRAWTWYLLTLFLFVCGLMCKPMLVTLPLVLLVLDFWPLRRARLETGDAAGSKFATAWRSWREPLLEKIPFYVLSLVNSVVTVLMQRDSNAFILDLPFNARLLNAFVAVMRYLGKFFWPFDLTVCYPHPGYWPAGIVVVAILLVTGLSLLAWRQRTRRPWLLAGWAWFLVVLLPAIGLVQVGFQSMADRYTYLALLGWQLAFFGMLREWSAHPALRRFLPVAGGMLLLGCAARTWDQEATWRDPIALFEHAAAVTERNDLAEGFIGYTRLGLGHVDEAVLHAQRALEINPKNETALYTLASAREQQGRLPEAAALCRTILQLNPTDAKTEYLLGAILLHLGQAEEAVVHMKSAAGKRVDLYDANLRIAIDETLHGQPRNAVAHYEVAAALNPKDAGIQFGYGLALAALGRRDEALARYQTAVTLEPGHPGAQIEIGSILLQGRQAEEAIGHFRIALTGQPKSGIAHLGLARALEQLGRTAEASASFAQAVACSPNDPMIFTTWAETIARRGQFAEAVPLYERALQLRPADAGMHASLGFVLFLSNRQEEAARQWEEALRLNPNFPGLRERLQKVRGEQKP